MRIGTDLAARPAAAGAAALAAALLGDADAAAARLEVRADPEALHDFRVELRRLRTVLRAFRPALGGAVRKRHLRRLGAIARATGAARDAEVQLTWLEAQRPRLAPPEIAGADWLARRLARRAGGAEGSGPVAHAEVLAEYRVLRARLRTRLARLEREGGGARGGALGHLLAALLRPQSTAFMERAAAPADARDVEVAHAARIEGKRLRYLLEPLRGTRGADARQAVSRLKALQELLGELHDAHVLEALLRRLRARERGERRAGLAALARLSAERRDASFGAFAAARRAGELDLLGREVEAVAAGLERRGRRLRAVPSGRTAIRLRRGAASTMMRPPRGAPDPERR